MKTSLCNPVAAVCDRRTISPMQPATVIDRRYSCRVSLQPKSSLRPFAAFLPAIARRATAGAALRFKFFTSASTVIDRRYNLRESPSPTSTLFKICVYLCNLWFKIFPSASTVTDRRYNLRESPTSTLFKIRGHSRNPGFKFFSFTSRADGDKWAGHGGPAQAQHPHSSKSVYICVICGSKSSHPHRRSQTAATNRFIQHSKSNIQHSPSSLAFLASWR